MNSVAVFQLLSCLMLCASCAHAIMVKFGTNTGPIVPPAPSTELPPAQPYRHPAPVWEDSAGDTPDPNSEWRPQPYVPQPRYTQINYNRAEPPEPRFNNVQQFVNAYKPRSQPIEAPPVKNFFTPAQILSSQSLPGIGIRYFVPAYINSLQERKNFKPEDHKANEIETNEVPNDSKYSHSDKMWLVEKEATKRNIVKEVRNPAFQWPERISENKQ